MCPGLKSVWFIVSELFAETCHTILQSFIWQRHFGVPRKETFMAAWDQQEHLELNLRCKCLLFARKQNYKLCLLMPLMGNLLKLSNRDRFFLPDSFVAAAVLVSRMVKI